MTTVKIRHYVVKRGKGFWQPTNKMREVGFGSVPCGPDGPAAWALAEQWNRRWDQSRTGVVPSPAMASAQNLSFENFGGADNITTHRLVFETLPPRADRQPGPRDKLFGSQRELGARAISGWRH